MVDLTRVGKSSFSGPDQNRPWVSDSPLPPLFGLRTWRNAGPTSLHRPLYQLGKLQGANLNFDRSKFRFFMTIFGHACRPSLKRLQLHSQFFYGHHTPQYASKDVNLHLKCRNYSGKCPRGRKSRAVDDLNLDFQHHLSAVSPAGRSIFRFRSQLANLNFDRPVSTKI